jgi:solute carrier family 25 (mitochondrial citrate transporter), member 1
MSTRNSPLLSVLSGGIAGGVEAAVTYPLEFAKTRAQLGGDHALAATSHIGKRSFRNPFKLVLTVYRNEGARALYKGCSALIVGSIGKDAVRFLSFDTIKQHFADPTTGTLSPGRNVLAGMAAGVCASIFAVTPTERIKTALIDDARGAKRFQSVPHAMKLILAEDGLVGFYRGFAGTTLKQASATACRFGTYNIIKDFERTRGVQQTTVVNFANGAVAGTVTALLSQPFDTIKTRSQTATKTTTMEAIRGIIADGGIRGFWKGTVMRLGRTVIAGGVMFTTAETVEKMIGPLMGQQARSHDN